MKPATRNLLILGVCIVVLGGALAALMLTGGETDASTTSSSQDIALLNREEADVASIEVTNTSGVFTIVPAEEQPGKQRCGQQRFGGGFQRRFRGYFFGRPKRKSTSPSGIGGTPAGQLRGQQRRRRRLAALCHQKIGAVSNLADFGLSTPQATVKVTFQNGDTYAYEIGNASVEDSTAYYVRGQGAEDVYVGKRAARLSPG